MNIVKKERKVITIVIAVIMLTGLFMLSVADKAYAADGRITIKVGERIDYSSHYTNYFYVGDKDSPAYCAQPQLPAPKSGTYNYNFISPTSILAKCLYYGYGGPGFDEYTDKQLSGSWEGKDDAYALTHIIISIAYDKSTSEEVDPFKGLSGTWKTKAQNLYNYIKTLPNPPINYRAYFIKTEGCQDILGSFNDVGNIKIKKSSADNSMTDGNTCYSLSGAKYGVYYSGNLIDTITTNAKGEGILENVLVANYTIKELSASKGYALDLSTYNCSVKDNVTTTLSVKEQPKDDPIGILLRKGDAETEKAAPQGAGSMRGAVYEVKYYKHTEAGKSLAATWRFTTDKNGIAHFAETDLDKSFNNSPFYISAAGDPCIPLGTVTVQEVKAPEGYLLNDRIYTTEITAGSGTVESVYTYNEPKIGSSVEMAEQPKRGDIKFVKVKDGTMERLANIQFKITSKTTGESHVVCTDDNGIVDTSSMWNKHEQDTNGGTAESGVWFGEISAIDEEKGALLYDYYTLDEIRGENNKNLKLLKDVEFRIYRDSTVLDLGTITNDIVKIKTEALDKKTRNHISCADDEISIIDTVSYKNLKEGKQYEMRGTIMDKQSGKPLEIKGKKVTSEKKFICEDENGKVELEFTFNASGLSGKEIVIFEKCFDIEAGEVIASHEDMDDENQSISIPEIKTKASGKDTSLNIVLNSGKQTIVDEIEYEKLLAGEKYRVKTWLADSKGYPLSGVPAVTKEFTADTSDGNVKTEIVLEPLKFAGMDIIVFEEIYIIDEESGKAELVGLHTDANDKNQTVSIPKIGTKATVKGSENNLLKPKGEQTIIDRIDYCNLIAGKEYKANTWLVDESGKKIDGTNVETFFTAEKKNGSINVEITFDAEKITGDKVIVFEEIYLIGSESEILVGEHKDLNDDNQTVKILMPSPKTGDDMPIFIIIAVIVIAITGAFAVLRKKENEKNKMDK